MMRQINRLMAMAMAMVVVKDLLLNKKTKSYEQAKRRRKEGVGADGVSLLSVSESNRMISGGMDGMPSSIYVWCGVGVCTEK